jgi:general secretion pathway protein H
LSIVLTHPHHVAGASLLPSAVRSRTAGFTLIELLITLVVIGVAVALVAINGLPNERQGLRFEAERLAQVLSLARDEAQVRGAPIRLSADASGYRFQILRDRQWRLIDDDADLRERVWSSPVVLTLNRADGRRDLEFGRDPVDSPFLLSLSRDGASVQMSANGLGLFEVLP